MKSIDNTSLRLALLPASGLSDDEMLAFSATFLGYEVWGGFDPCAIAANEIEAAWERSGALPDSLTLLRTALFFEARRERFVDYGGFGDDPAGLLDHRRYMHLILEAIRSRVAEGELDEEDHVVVSWLESHEPAGSAYLDYDPDPEWPDAGPPVLDGEHVAATVALAARMLALDLRSEQRVDEDRLRIGFAWRSDT